MIPISGYLVLTAVNYLRHGLVQYLRDTYGNGTTLLFFKKWYERTYDVTNSLVTTKGIGLRWASLAAIIERNQFRYIKIQLKSKDFSTRLWGITKEFVGIIPPAPRSEDYCVEQSFNKSKLVYYNRLLSSY